MIYIDLDRVCADFNRKVIEVTGKDYCGKESWNALDKVPNLFYSLEVLPGSIRAIFLLTEEFGYDGIEFLTALPKNTGLLYTAHKDKVSWVHNKIAPAIFTGYSPQVNCVQDWSYKKYFCSSKGDILIDDSQRNIDDWVQAGGTGILHRSWEDTLEQCMEIVPWQQQGELRTVFKDGEFFNLDNFNTIR